MFHVSRLALLIAALLAARVRADDRISVIKADPTTEYKTFDPKNPNHGAPLEGDEAAICLYRFEVSADTRYSFTGKPEQAISAPQKVDIKSVKVSVRLKITIWLPNTADDHLKEHEEAHRKLAEHYYKDAETIARAAAEKIPGTTVFGEGETREKAAENAISTVNDKITDAYLKAIELPCKIAQDHFDDITDHGRKKTPAAAEAIKRSIEKAREKSK